MKSLIAAAVLAILAVPTTASAHVTVTPPQAPAGSFTVLNVRVPHEAPDSGTVKVDMRLPDGVYFLSYKMLPGWRVQLTRKQLDAPVDLGGGFSASERFTRIVWRGNPRRGAIIRPDQFEEFPIFMRIPDGKPGDQVVFPAVQTYRDGERVAWTGGPGTVHPASRLTLTAPVVG
jgi:periplasmic copper chaperone A